jgi:putative hydrolase
VDLKASQHNALGEQAPQLGGISGFTQEWGFSVENMNPEDFEKFLKDFMAGKGGDAAELAAAAGLPNDPNLIAKMVEQLQTALGQADNADGSVNWKLATDQARTIAREGAHAIDERTRKAIRDALSIGSLWLDEVTSISALTTEPKLLTRELWVADAMPLFEALSAPVANRMSEALAQNLKDNAPEELSAILGNAAGLMRSAGGALFAMQLGQALGKLSAEVLTGGDIGLPIFHDQRAAFVPQNLEIFVNGLEIETDQAYIYLGVRELAHTRLFKHSKWLRDSIVSQVANYAAGITIDNERITEIADDFNPTNTDELKRALETGAFIAARSDEQQMALDRIETMLALIEGWVEVITEDATKLLPKASSISEAIRRRRATGGPAEQTFGTIVGLELRPRRSREAAEMWRRIGAAVGHEKRDQLWDHPDLLPTSDDIADPSRLIAKLSGNTSQADDFDQALRDLLGE